MKLKFSTIKNEIMFRIKNNNIDFGEDVGLVDGFVEMMLRKDYDQLGKVIGGYNMPAIAFVGDKSFRIYLVSFKMLFPELDYTGD